MLKKTILLGLTAVLMTACGSNDSGGVSSSGGSGECVDVASPEEFVGITVRRKSINYRGGKVTNSTITSSSIDEFTDTSHKSTLYDDNENIIGKLENEHFISDGYIKATKVILDWVSYPDTEMRFDPYNQSEFRIGKNCKGDVSKNSYVQYEKIDGKEESKGTKIANSFTIEEVNVEITLPAGTFNTMKLKFVTVGKSGYHYNWVDIDTGIKVLTEVYDENDKLAQRVEALDIY